MMLVRHQRGKENDGSARRALLIFVPWSPALPAYLFVPNLSASRPNPAEEKVAVPYISSPTPRH